jgi:hypothetical protein
MLAAGTTRTADPCAQPRSSLICFRGRFLRPVAEQNHQRALKLVLLFPGGNNPHGESDELTGLHPASCGGAQDRGELLGLTGVWPGRGKPCSRGMSRITGLASRKPCPLPAAERPGPGMAR